MPVKGIERVKKQYKEKVQKISGELSYRSVYEILVTGAGAAGTMVPIETSNLINSQYAPQIQVDKGQVSGHIGYTANYAAAVHEAPGKLMGLPRASGKGNYWDPAGEPKFLEKGFEMVKPNIPAILRKNYSGK